jgi:uncharacterized protein with PQ loop repeat
MIALIVILFLLLALVDFPKLIRSKNWYEVSVLSAFFFSAFVLAILQSYGITVNPIKGAESIIKDMLHINYS